MKIVTLNVNGIRSAERKGLIQWLSSENPDIFCLQEVKAEENQANIEQYKELGYHSFWNSAEKKGYSGVATFSKLMPKSTKKGLGLPEFDSEGRLLFHDFGEFKLINTYFPSGTSGQERQDYKYRWLEAFSDFLKSASEDNIENVFVCGDLNICHREIDIHNPKVATARNYSGFQPAERAWISEFLEGGFVDIFRQIHPTEKKYSWWSYRANAKEKNLGWRIDYFMVHQKLFPRISSCQILDNLYFSDHCPIVVEFS